MMKRLFMLVSLLLAVSMAFAQNLSREEALRYAEYFFGDDTTPDQLSVVWTGTKTSNPAFYAINRSTGGFLVLSGNKCVNPVLGYSHTGKFLSEGMPANVLGWFTSLEKDIENVRLHERIPSTQVASEWETIGVQTKGGTGVLYETALWDQGGPYNLLCNMPDGSRAITGCAATAMAIMLRFNKYPEHGFGELPSYTTGTKHYYLEGYDITDHYYNWDIMPLKDYDVKRASEEAQLQIATLIHDCGVMIEMDYTSQGSGASSMDVPGALAKYMGYSASALLYRKAYFKPEEWISMLKAELDSGKPLYYSAQDANGSGGHAFIVDGYDQNNLFHVNWGWSGSENAYFNLDMEVNGYRFSERQGAILDLVPDPDRINQAYPYLALSGSGISLKAGKLEAGQKFTVSVSTLANLGNVNFKGPVQLVLIDKNGNIKENASEPQSVEIASQYQIQFDLQNCVLNSNPAFSDRLVLMAKSPKTGQYQQVPNDRESSAVGSLSAVPDFIATEASYKAGDTFLFDLYSGSDPIRSIEWFFDGTPVLEEASKVLEAGTHEVKAVITKSSGTETLIRELVVK